MTKEILNIIQAYKAAHASGRQTALATVVHVEGSSYRRPGARMLVEDTGTLTGAISGGCLEGDAYRKAMLAMSDMRNRVITYNSMDDDDITFGVQLGCNGIVHILLEPINNTHEHNPIQLLEYCSSQRRESVLATLFSLDGITGLQPGTCLFADGNISKTNLKDEQLADTVNSIAASALEEGSSILTQIGENSFTVFAEVLRPPVSLHVVGAGNDAFPLVDIASVLGWQITLIDGRPSHANSRRFPQAQEIIVNKPEEAILQVKVDDSTVFILMTHNYNYDLAALGYLLQTDCRYIGLLGPKKRFNRLINDLSAKGIIITDKDRARMYGPMGLDIGAESPEEIALSILAEIKAAMTQHPATFLRNKIEPIHPRPLKNNSE